MAVVNCLAKFFMHSNSTMLRSSQKSFVGYVSWYRKSIKGKEGEGEGGIGKALMHGMRERGREGERGGGEEGEIH